MDRRMQRKEDNRLEGGGENAPRHLELRRINQRFI